MGVLSAGYTALHQSKDELLNTALNDLESLFPAAKTAKIKHALVNIERQATLSSRVGVNPSRPQTAIYSNAYVVGDWVQTGLPATIESAVRSARLMQDDLIQKEKLKS